MSDTRTGNNTITAWSISDSNGVVQSSTSTGGNLPFAVSTAAGTLTITKAQRQLTITVKNQEYDYDGNAKGAPNDTITADFGKYVEVEGLATGDTLTSLTILGQMTDAGTYTGALVASNAAISSTNYNYTVQYVAGNLIINADETAPTGTITVSSEAWERFESWDSLQSEISFDKYSNKNYTVSIAANDSGSGVASFGYLTSNAEISDEELSKRTDWISYTDPFELTAEGKYIIYAKITDNSNNVTYISTRGLVLDKTAPAFEGIEKNSTYCCQVQFTVDDTTPVVVFVNGSAITADSQGVYTISTTTGGDYTVRAVDNAGNETQAQIRINSNHVYGDPNYTWDGFTSCLAEITCANCPWSDQEYGTITNAVTTQPTCTAAGERTYTATFSEAWAETRTKTESISALNHDLIFHAGQNPTCTVGGWFAYETCTHCDYSTYEAISPLGHEPVQHDGQAPTCTEVGWNEYFTCIRCSYSTYVEIPALGHNEETHVAKEATCTDVGWNEYVTCTRCDYSTYVEIPALGHNEETHDAQEPTCTDVGWNEYVTCTRCDYTTYSEIPALGHNEETHDAQEATCTEEGWNEYVTCTRCDYSTYVEIPALGHDEETHEAKVPTCTEIGWNEYDTCSRCDYTTYEEIAALGHSYGTEWTNEKDSHWHECSACGDKADAAKHTPKTVNAKEATRTEKGYTGDTVCETCGYEIAKGKVIPVISDPNNPQTGDNSHMALWIALMILSCGGVIGTTVYSKKKRTAKR
ncbi:MAG: hypothetical protein Q4D44_00550 [Eubacteriales bacterium]|nr:hypothetical protein [Eubacteriales bacterium]